MTGIRITGTGGYAPKLVVNNQDFTAVVDTSDEWIRTRTGMQERHIATDEPTWLLGVLAAREALQRAECDPLDIDMVITTTVTGDYYSPAIACIIQGEVGAVNAFALDINVACTGLAFSLDMAKRYLETGMNKILLVCAESLSQITNYEDRGTCVLFGDGAGALVVERGEGPYGAFSQSDPSGVKQVYAKRVRREHPFLPQGQTMDTAAHDSFEPDYYNALVMKGSAVYKFAVKAMPLAVEKACEAAGVEVADLQMVIPHQANLRIVETAMKNLGLPMEKAYVNIHKYGNTSSATIAMGLHECAAQGLIHRGDLVCLVGMGAGLTYGACVFTY